MEEFIEKDSFEFGDVNNNEGSNFETVDNVNVFNAPFSNLDENNAVNENDYQEPEFEELEITHENIEEDSDVIESSEGVNVFENGMNEDSTFDFESKNIKNTKKIDSEFLEENPETFSSSMDDVFEYDVVAPTIEPNTNQKNNEKTSIISDTPIEELNKLTEYKEEKISVTDIKSLFNRVGNNVQEASDIFVKNTEMKERLDAKFEELKQLQATIENAKKTQYDEINAYKEEVFGKLTEKKSEIEERINKLKDFQANLEKEKEEFEKYKNEQNAEIENVQKEIQEAYDARREELNHIEDVLRKQKDALDEERTQLSLDKIQYESDKNELANNLLKFNQIVDSFTIGMGSTGKEE